MDIKTKITEIQTLSTGEGVLTVEDSSIFPFQVSKAYMEDLNPIAGGYYIAINREEGFNLTVDE